MDTTKENEMNEWQQVALDMLQLIGVRPSPDATPKRVFEQAKTKILRDKTQLEEWRNTLDHVIERTDKTDRIASEMTRLLNDELNMVDEVLKKHRL